MEDWRCVATDREWCYKTILRWQMKHIFHYCGTLGVVLSYCTAFHNNIFFLHGSTTAAYLSFRAVLLEISPVNARSSLFYSLCNNSTNKNTVQQYSCFKTWAIYRYTLFLLLAVNILCSFFSKVVPILVPESSKLKDAFFCPVHCWWTWNLIDRKIVKSHYFS